jgi:hypothetical protein
MIITVACTHLLWDGSMNSLSVSCHADANAFGIKCLFFTAEILRFFDSLTGETDVEYIFQVSGSIVHDLVRVRLGAGLTREQYTAETLAQSEE